MTPKSLGALALVTALSTAAAVWQVSMSASIGHQVSFDRPAFPSFKEASGKVAEVKVRTSEMTLTLRKIDGGWGVAEKDFYPVASEKVRAALIDVASLKLVEPKTSDPERYDRLFLRDPGSEGAKSKGLTFLDGEGNILADLVVGKKKFSMLSGGKDGTYIRKAGDKQSWLALGAVAAGDGAEDWLVKSIFDMPAARVKRLTLLSLGQEPLEVYREQEDETAMKLAGIGANEAVADQYALDDAKETLNRLDLNDVAAAAKIPLPEDADTAILETFDGLKIVMRHAEIGKRHWVLFEAEGTSDATKKEADEINERLRGWVFDIPPWKARVLKMKRDKLVKLSQ